jgi:hypothetical protein
VVSKVARTNPAKVVSSRAGRTNPVNKVVSNADLKSKTRHLYKRRAFPYWKFTSTDRHGALNLTYAQGANRRKQNAMKSLPHVRPLVGASEREDIHDNSVISRDKRNNILDS